MESTLKRETADRNDTVLSKNLGGGPHGFGDPDDTSLRRVEKEIMIPQKMKAKAKKEICAEEVKKFGECAKEKGFLMPFLCRGIGRAMGDCLSNAYSDPAFIKKCTKEYLEERSEYRRTGVRTSTKNKKATA
ncbi:Mitochondrial aspartate/glutamate carrier protein [Bulinus truncatus]|nr:Mitochondrial aspartate/glutamate carrier protein [Bulinus truncatus]